MSQNHTQLTYGLHSAEALVNSSPNNIDQLYLLKGRDDKRLLAIYHLAEKHCLNVQWVNRHDLDKLAKGNNHQGVIALTQNKLEAYDESYLKSHLVSHRERGISPFLLVLDGVTDPHNLGACLRSAEAAGVQFVIVPKNNSAPLSSTVIKVSCGAAEVVPLVRVTNLVRTLLWLQKQGVWTVGTASEAEKNHYQTDLTGPLAIVMGSEGKGLRRLTRETCDELVHIPMLGAVGSLNVSVAAGVCLFESVRQREQKK